MNLETHRFLLRNLDLKNDNLMPYLSWMRNKELNPFIQGTRVDMTLDQLHQYVIEKNSNENTLFLGVFEKVNQQHIGNVKLEPIVPNEHAVLGILIGEQDWRGKGVGYEVLSRIISFSFSELNLRELRLGVHPKNLRAQALYLKLGFRHEHENMDDVTSLSMIRIND